MSENKTLRDCPFCGSSDIESQTVFVCAGQPAGEPIPIRHVLQCQGCRVSTKAYDTFEEAAERWNTRADTPSVQSAPDTVRRQEAIRELEKASASTRFLTVPVSRETIQTALSALKDKVLIPPVSELLKKNRVENFRKAMYHENNQDENG